MSIGLGNDDFNPGDFAVIAFAMAVIWATVRQFQTGEVIGKGGYTRRSDKPRRFAFIMAFWIFLSVVSVLVSVLDVYARVHHLPRCAGC